MLKQIFKKFKLPLGDHTVEIPCFSNHGKGDKKVLITAGADGDEYASIEAAYRLCEIINKRNSDLSVTIIPILNIAGFEKGVSFNPLDGKYPKYFYPGNKKGGETEILINWLSENFLKGIDCWIDMHGGAIGEILYPYIYFYKTGKRQLDQIHEKIISSVKTERVIYQNADEWDKTVRLARNNILYILTEAGYSGKRDRKFVRMHIDWTIRILDILDNPEMMIKPVQKRVYSKIYTVKAGIKGIWYPNYPQNLLVKKNQLMGILKGYDDKLIQEIKSPVDGEFLYGKESMPASRNERLMEIAYDPIVFN